MKLITMLVFLIPAVVARHSHRTVLESILKSKDNLYTKVDNDVQNVMNSLFDNLDLAPTFLAKSRIKSLLTMHYDLNNMAEKNFDIFENMTEAARPDTGNETSKGLALFKLIRKTLDDEFLNMSLKENKKLQKSTIKDTIEKAANTSSETDISLENISPSDTVFADSKEFKKFIKDFIKKVDKLNETDFSKSTPLLPPIEEDTTHPNNEFWEPPPNHFNETRRIFKGKRSRSKTYPFVVSVHLLETFVCAGSIVSSDLILTAASCLQVLHNNRFFRENPRSVYIRIGSDHFSRRGEMIPIFESFFHPGYNPKTLADNLVLLRLIRRISFKKQGRVKKIMYDRTKGNLAVNTNGIIVLGWGSRKRNNIIDQYERLMAAKLDIYQRNECAKIYSEQFVTNKHFCAGFVATGGGACNKDLGGPGIVGGVLVGVISFGAPLCGAIDAPTVFTKIGYYAEWIDSIIAQEGPVVAARTTLASGQANRYFVDPNAPPPISPYRTTRGFIEPLLRLYSDEFKHVVRRRTKPRPDFDQLFPYTPTTRFPIVLPLKLLRGWLYDDYGITIEDVNDMFKTTRKLENGITHPLVNKSLIPIKGIHKIVTKKEKYRTIRLTTVVGGKELSPEPVTTQIPSPVPTRMPLTTTVRIIDLVTQETVTYTQAAWTPKKISSAEAISTDKPQETTTEPVTEPEVVYYSEEKKTLRFKEDYYN
ncbi:hypothetical protein PYW08_009443 [Mythimna loreyi]|uniref:Uncharacterized protein n=1 Tax=Mythimna loreyi TaxID=667449 RepID=A0ACC2Q8R8_9NEOP|nr:hypothetical protein PYW08_009443 [Mythimna loreyi]